MLSTAKAVATLPAEDIQRAVNFYTEKVGLKALGEPDEMAAVMLEAGDGSQVFIYQRERTKAEHTALTFFVEDVEAEVKALAEKGVTFEQYDFGEIKTNEMGIAELGENKAAWFVDPEGNVVSVTQM